MATSTCHDAGWGKSLTSVTTISHQDIARIVGKCTKTPKNSTNRGYKFFWDSYVHNVEVKPCPEGCKIRAKCHRSMKKNEKPHNIKLTVLNGGEVDTQDNMCSCTAGKGLCQHQVALFYQLAHYQALSVDKVPEIVSSTSAPQKWHIPPRTHGFTTRPITDVTVIKPVQPSNQPEQPAKKKRNDDGVQSKLYNPVNVPLSSLQMPQKLLPTLREHPTPVQWLQLWSREEESPLVPSKFGLVPKGSLLSYHEKPAEEVKRVGPVNPPPYDYPDIHYDIEAENIPAEQQAILDSLRVTVTEANQYEKDTRDQAKCPEWHLLRKNRLTASQFKSISGRRGKHDKLAKDLVLKKNITTAAMQYGVDHEEEAATKYAGQYGVDVHKAGFVINPTSFYLGCSPDRRVFDKEDGEQWGLLEIKCTTKDSVTVIQCLKLTDGKYNLRKSHQYYEQCMGQMGITGSKWCDFFVWCEADFHCERIHYDHDFFEAMKAKLDSFFFAHFLPSVASYRQD